MKINDYRLIVRTKQVEYLGADTDYNLQWKQDIKAVMLNKKFSTKNEAVEYLQDKGWKLDIGSTRRLINHTRNYEACVVPAVEIKCGNDLYRSPLDRDRTGRDFYQTLMTTQREQRDK